MSFSLEFMSAVLHWTFIRFALIYCVPHCVHILCWSFVPLSEHIIVANGLRCSTWLGLSASGQRPVREWRMCFQCVYSICVHLRPDFLICVHATLPTLQVAHSWGALATNIQSHQRNYGRQHSLCIPRTEQMERVIQWIKHNERGSASSGVKGWSKNGENNICQGFVQGQPLCWWT